MPYVSRYRYMAMRRISQISIIALFAAGNASGWNILRGNLSASKLFDTVPLPDPFALLQILAAVKMLSFETILGALVITVFLGGIGEGLSVVG